VNPIAPEPRRERIRVAFVIHDFDQTFGQGRYGIEIARFLASKYEFVVYSNTFSAPGIPGIRWVHVPTWRWNVVTTVFSFLPAAEYLVRRDKPDIIHCQGMTCWSADVITAHICNSARSRSGAMRQRRARWFIRLVTPLERWFYQQRRARHMIAISKVTALEIQSEYAWRRPFTVLHHGTNTGQFRPAASAAETTALRFQFGLPADRWVWLFVGEAVKGLRQVIDQLPHFPNAHLLAVTRSDLERYQTQARQLGVTQRITFWGYTPQPELAYRAADVFVYPSDYDPFGMVGSEAMATGLPVVLGKNIGVAELVLDGVNGLLCDPDHPESIREQLARLEADPARARMLGQAARETTLETSWQHNAEAVGKIYDQVFRNRTGKGA
jgi:glycosyltransferase involved in cell wall biosynthesis